MLVVHGALDLASAPVLRAKARQAIAGVERGVVVDVSDVEFVDSVGIGVLLGMRRRLANNDAALVIAGLAGAARTALEATGVVELFTEVDAVADLDD